MIKNITTLQVEKLNKSFKQGKNTIHVLKNISLSVKKGEIMALVGPSGCGKTTLLQLLGLLDKPDSGHIIINGTDYNTQDNTLKTNCRLNHIGFIYQSYNLLNDFTALENCIMPLLIAKHSRKEASLKAIELLSSLGLKNRIQHLPSQLSGGEQQRVAIARSIIHQPDLILADEPTGNLDHDNAKKVMDILIRAVRQMQKSLVIVTHNLDIVKDVDKIMTISNAHITTKK
jgi:lipoprotein-releasing system ATP-binding protein